MSSQRILFTAISALLMLGVPAWAGDHGEGHGEGHGKHEGEHHGAYHGKKKGWRGCNLPPGQAKKHGCYVGAAVPPPPPPPTYVVAPPPVVHVQVAPLPPPPPPPANGVQIHVDAVIHP